MLTLKLCELLCSRMEFLKHMNHWCPGWLLTRFWTTVAVVRTRKALSRCAQIMLHTTFDKRQIRSHWPLSIFSSVYSLYGADARVMRMTQWCDKIGTRQHEEGVCTKMHDACDWQTCDALTQKKELHFSCDKGAHTQIWRQILIVWILGLFAFDNMFWEAVCLRGSWETSRSCMQETCSLKLVSLPYKEVGRIWFVCVRFPFGFTDDPGVMIRQEIHERTTDFAVRPWKSWELEATKVPMVMSHFMFGRCFNDGQRSLSLTS